MAVGRADRQEAYLGGKRQNMEPQESRCSHQRQVSHVHEDQRYVLCCAQWHLRPLRTTRDASLYRCLPHLEAAVFLHVCSTGTVTEPKYFGNLIFRYTQQGSCPVQCLTCSGQATRKPVPSLSYQSRPSIVPG